MQLQSAEFQCARLFRYHLDIHVNVDLLKEIPNCHYGGIYVYGCNLNKTSKSSEYPSWMTIFKRLWPEVHSGSALTQTEHWKARKQRVRSSVYWHSVEECRPLAQLSVWHKASWAEMSGDHWAELTTRASIETCCLVQVYKQFTHMCLLIGNYLDHV